MIKFIDNIKYLYSEYEIENSLFEKANEHYRNQVKKVFDRVSKIKTNNNAIVYAVGDIENNKISFELECENKELAKQIMAIFQS